MIEILQFTQNMWKFISAKVISQKQIFPKVNEVKIKFGNCKIIDKNILDILGMCC